MNDINNVDWMLLYPMSLAKDQEMKAMAEVFVEQIDKLLIKNLDNLLIYPNMGNLSEDLLKELSEDFGVDWYDDSYTDEQKRSIIKNAMLVQRTKGTAGAVETALSDIYKNSTLQEWFEYKGLPFYFRVFLNASETGMQASTLEKVIEKIRTYKNTRSHLEQVHVENRQRGEIKVVGGQRTGRKIVIQAYQPEEYIAEQGIIAVAGGMSRITRMIVGGKIT